MAPSVKKLILIVREGMEWAGVDCSQKLDKGDLTLLQHIRQEILKLFATAERENGKGAITNSSLICELQDEVEFCQAQCHELREELKQLKEKLKLCQEKKEDLQAEVGKQLFLESKEMRREKICQPPNGHVRGRSLPGRVTEAWPGFSCADLKPPDDAGLSDKSGFFLQQRLEEISNSLSELELSRIKNLVGPKLNSFRLARIREGSKLFEELERKGEFSCSFVRDLVERIHRFDLVEKLPVPFHHGDESYGGESYSSLESNQRNEVSESLSGVDGKQSDDLEERKDIIDNIEAYGEVQFCNSSTVHPFHHHFNDTEDGAVNLPDRAQDSLMLEDFTDVNQDSSPYGDTTQRQNVSVARITVEKETATDQSDSHVGHQSNKWQHLGARPRDRPLNTDQIPKSSPLYSSEDLVPPQVVGPVAHGVANAFLARHSEDKHLHESLCNINAETFTENSSLQGASHVDGMLNLIDSNKAELNFGDCQFAFRQDPYYKPHSSPLFPQTGGAYIVGNSGSNSDFSLLNPSARVNESDSRLLSGLEQSRSGQLLPVTTDRDVLDTYGESNSSSIAVNTSGDHLASGHHREHCRAHYSSGFGLISGANTGGSLNQQSGQTEDSVSNRNHGTESVESTGHSLLELEQHVEEACAMVERVLREREEREEFGWEIERKECEIQAERVQKKREREAREQEEASYCHHEQEERETGAGGLQTTTYGPCVVESLNFTDHNSPQALLEGIEAAKAKEGFQASLSSSGPCRVRPQSGHDECCACLQDTFSGLQVLPCSHKIHLQCIVRLIQGKVLLCPSCLCPFLPPKVYWPYSTA